MIEASNKLAQEVGAWEYSHETKYSDGIVPLDTRKEDIDELVKPVERMNWKS